ncbi:MAG: DUF1297 domain-containing protein [Candidatus Bilamarchaeaceae archaeon]
MRHTIATLGSHSALDVCEGAKAEGFGNMVVCKKGREKTYLGAYKTRKRGGREIGVVDEVVLLNDFKEIVEPTAIGMLQKKNAVFVPNRSFSVYVGYENIEKKFAVPIFGNKYLLRAEERDAQKNQYYLLGKGGVRTPQTIKDPAKIDRLCIVKVNEAKRSYERAFFLCSSPAEFEAKSAELMKAGKIRKEDLKNARIEEFILGAHFNFNFFYSGVHEELELLGIDTRRQTSIDGYLRLPADQQMEALKKAAPTTIEVGHIACTIRESLLEQVFELGERFVHAVEKEYKDGLVGPFALQGAMVEEGKEDFVCFDVSFRMPGSPGTKYTPYTRYLFHEEMSVGRRVAVEIKEAEKEGTMERITT